MRSSLEAISSLAQDGENDTPPIISRHFLEAMHNRNLQDLIIFSRDEVETMRQNHVDPRRARKSFQHLTGHRVVLIGEKS